MQILTLLFCLSTAFAENSKADEAEYKRLSTEMEKFSRKNVWDGVEKKYMELQKLGIPIAANEYIIAAQSAQERGDILTAKHRLELALELDDQNKTREWYEELDLQYGDVTLISRSKDFRTLNYEGVIASPAQAKAIEYARKVLVETGAFTGVLPYGTYNFGGQQFQVVAGMTIHLELSPHLKNKLNKSN